MKICWHEEAWEHYLFWQQSDPGLLKRINALVKECARTPFTGTGKPEPLKGNLRGFWSRRITEKHRLVYRIEGDTLNIAQCRFHYDDK